ncbi:type 2 lanthipeptide synthetase LanM family protein [Amycolatopsis sp. NPDC049253]|uniref:type 2 lanthipeptide synthetase LanM family protein n=1 Tax=Amycolatopsis sp. NPDC049253 TaxID=3155274 RepID=UPI003440E723
MSIPSFTPRWWSPGLTSGERRAGDAVPAWARFVEGVVEDGTRERLLPADWRGALTSVFDPFTREARRRAGGGADFAAELGGRLLNLGIRTLVLELHHARAAGRLDGETPETRFTDFVRQTGTRGGLTGLLTTYPVLARLLGQACLDSADAHRELLDRLDADRAALGVGDLVAVHGGFGDAHRRGRSVKVLEFADGTRLVYKPRSLALHAHFGEVVAWLGTHLPGLELRTVDAVVRDGYGWLTFVGHRPCADLTEVDRFHRRQGILLALLHALDGTDVHFENVIAAGDQPVLIDLETLFHPSPHRGGEGPDPAAEALAGSVHRTSLLPQMFLGEHGAVDISGLSGGSGGRLPADRVGWLDPGTDRMRLTRVPAELPGGVNRPRLGGRAIEPAEHSAALLAGFRLGYDTIAAHRDELTGLLARCAGDEIRVLIRPTNFYARVLDETTHPDLLRAADDRDAAFGLLAADSADPVRGTLVPSELADLWAGDVPLFTGRPGAADLWDSAGRRFPDLLPAPPLRVVTEKIAAMTSVDQRDQAWLISAALATRPGPVTHRCDELADAVPVIAPTAAQVLAAASGIADQILARAFSRDGRANWLGLELVEERYWTVLPMGAGLGEGYPGVALFLAQLARLTDVDRYHDLAVRALRPIPALLARFTADPELAAAAGCGGLLGLGGVAYALARLATLLDEPAHDLVEQAVAAMPAPDPALPRRFTTGLAGGITALRSVATLTGLAAATRLADDYADLAARPAPEGEPPGFAFGSAGIHWALKEKTDFPPEPTEDHGWCSGLAGLTLAHAHDPVALERLGGLDSCVTRLAERAPLRDMSLCHGEFGVVDVLVTLAEGGHPGAREAVAKRTGAVLAAIGQRGALCGTPGAVPSPGLLTGLAGIGYGLLRLGFAEQVPSALLLQPLVHRSERNTEEETPCTTSR